MWRPNRPKMVCIDCINMLCFWKKFSKQSVLITATEGYKLSTIKKYFFWKKIFEKKNIWKKNFLKKNFFWKKFFWKIKKKIFFENFFEKIFWKNLQVPSQIIIFI